MKTCLQFLLCLLISASVAAQKSTSRSKTGSLVPRAAEIKKPADEPAPAPAPAVPAGNQETIRPVVTNTNSNASGMDYYTPFLKAEVSFTDPSDNNNLDAGEEWNIHIKLRNIGKMPAENCDIQLLQEIFNPNISISPIPGIAKIESGEEKEFDVKVRASGDITTGKTPLKLVVLENRGFDLEPELRLTIPTRQFQPPDLGVVDYVIQDQNRNSKIEKREMVDVIFRIQNKGESTAQGAKATVILGANVLPIDVPAQYDLGDIKPGDFKDITASIVTNARTTEGTMTVDLAENTGKFSKEKFFTMPFDVMQKKPDELAIAARGNQQVAIPEVSSMKLDIAENIPSASKPKEYGIAVIIGNKDYEHAPNVDFAINDAQIVRNYAKKALGYKEVNTISKDDAKQSDLYSIFGNENNYRGQLYNYAVKGQSEVFVYYSGHGAPDPNTNQGYLVPADCDPNTVALNGYPLQLLMNNLQKLIEDKQVKQVTVVLDACFSGSSEAGSLLKNVSPVSVRLKDQDVGSDKMTVFSSTSGDQLSNWYPEMRQSLYTYFFLKGLKGEADIDKNHVITALELHQYVADEVNGVPYWAKRLHNGRSQTPTIKGKLDSELYK